MTTTSHLFSMVCILTAATSLASAAETQKATPERPPQLFVVALEDSGKRGKEIGCGDSLVSIPADLSTTATSPVSPPVVSALTLLLTLDKPTSGSEELYNALAPSRLKVKSVAVKAQTATIHLSGQLQLGGACDNPRIEEQLRATVLQFPEIGKAKIFINGEPLESLLSAK